MIKAFSHKGLQVFFERDSTAGIQAKHAAWLRNILYGLDSAEDVKDMALPGYNLHQLKGDVKGV